MTDSDQERFLAINKTSWNKIAGSSKGRTALPNYGPLCPDEDELGLLGDVHGKAIVELGCGDGRSLAYLHARGASELCGLDLAEEQIANAQALAEQEGFAVTLHAAPMESDPGIAHGHYDLALSLYALGWCVDLAAALQRAHEYLRAGGVLVYSWEHPVYSCLKKTDSGLSLARSYSEVGPVHSISWNGDPIVMQARKVSTFVNATIAAGFVLDEIIEGDLRDEPAKIKDYPRRWYCKDRARLMPTTLIVKAHKP